MPSLSVLQTIPPTQANKDFKKRVARLKLSLKKQLKAIK